MIHLIHGECLEEMAKLPDGCVDMVMCDLPYGTTACSWDTVIDLGKLWVAYKRICKGAVVLTAAQPFTTILIMSNIKDYRHSWVWNKRFASNYPQAKRAPMRIHEDVVVFGPQAYKPQMTKRDVPIKKGANKGARVFNSGLERDDYIGKVYDEKYPESIIEFSSREEKRGLHPTQKPVQLMEYLIKTYTNEGMTVLDNCMGSGTTGVACVNTNRNFIGIEKDDSYFKICRERIQKAEYEYNATKLDELFSEVAV